MRQARERMTGLSGPAFDGARLRYRRSAGLLVGETPPHTEFAKRASFRSDMRLSLTFNRQSIYPTGMVGQGTARRGSNLELDAVDEAEIPAHLGRKILQVIQVVAIERVRRIVET